MSQGEFGNLTLSHISELFVKVCERGIQKLPLAHKSRMYPSNHIGQINF